MSEILGAELWPYFLTRKIATGAVRQVFGLIRSGQGIFARLKRQQMHAVILVPVMRMGQYPKYQIEPLLLHEMSMGDPGGWEHRYDEIARCKALQLWSGRNDGGFSNQPHLLFAGDTPYWGGVKRDGIVVACSGVQPYFDRMCAGMIADMAIACAHDEYEDWRKGQSAELDFVNEYGM